ncbi:potassium channel family protein [Chroococcus sp. FPU101]|uniref:potassium channel family protein n=1 Tax=Chroococcus sp. FPU101 TaxID=1974212 RepID=UPI001A8EA2FA|nr:potassium channel family protein [Chroococcus sp. FPU101]GFE68233.1 Ion transport 2 domain protein [Chroococcus sp. FPU101]
MNPFSRNSKQIIEQERYEILQQIEDWLDLPMLFLSFVWLILFIVELVWGLNPFLDTLQVAIWILFGLDFLLEFALAPVKVTYLKRNWLTVVSLLLPALRLFRFTRILRVFRSAKGIRSLRLLQIMTRTNRGMRSLATSFQRRGFGYIIGLTTFVCLIGAAGMYAFEKDVPSGLSDYGTALWWTAMVMTTMGADYFPKTPEGRLLCFFLAVYAFAIFGYVAATLATFFIGQDAENPSADVVGMEALANLQQEVKALREEIQVMLNQKLE